MKLFILGTMFYTAVSLIPAETTYVKPEFHDNRYYCELIRAGEMQVVGAEGSVAELCKSWGVKL